MNITQSMEQSLVGGYKMCLICMASVIRGNYVNMRWSGKGMKSLWVKQLQAMIHGNGTVKKLCFKPWLDVHAGKYTCRVYVKNSDNYEFIVKKLFTINGMYTKHCFRVTS